MALMPFAPLAFVPAETIKLGVPMWDDVLLYVIIGFVAQMIDGAIGMAYGVTASSVLLGLGVPPATASACVHAAGPSPLRLRFRPLALRQY